MGTGWGGVCSAPETPAALFPWAILAPPFLRGGETGGLPTPALGCCRLLCGLALGPFLGLSPFSSSIPSWKEPASVPGSREGSKGVS